MPNYVLIDRIAIGRVEDDFHPNAFKAAFAELIATFIFIFAGQGSTMAYNKLTGDAPTSPSGLIQVALAHGFGLFVGVSVAANISDGHCNPAVTFGAFIGGHISLLRGILYWIGQLLGSAIACALLKFCTHYEPVSVFSLSTGVTVWDGFVFEIIMTFALVYTVYATAIDPKKGALGTIAPLATGLVLAANILGGGAFTGAAANPAVAFGPALVSWTWENHWIYWAGDLIGGGIAGLIYGCIFISNAHEPLPVAEY